MARITHWTIKIKWDDGTEEFIDDIPNYVATNVDSMLDGLEQLKSTYENNGRINKRSSEGCSPATA
jgi:hypothetical protein